MNKGQLSQLKSYDPLFGLVSTKPQFDNGPGKYRIGVIVMSTDYVTERDFANMRPSDDVVCFVARIPNSNDNNPESLSAMEHHLGATASLILPGGRVDVIAYSCTAASAILGQQRIEKAIWANKPGIPCVTPIQAAISALEAIDIKRIAVVTPYQDSVNTHVRTRLEASGLTITNFLAFNFTDDTLMANLDPISIEAAIIEADCPEADAIFVSCTAIRACELISNLEKKLKKPIITAVQAMYWNALRLAGCTEKINGYGKLLSDQSLRPPSAHIA